MLSRNASPDKVTGNSWYVDSCASTHTIAQSVFLQIFAITKTVQI